jgi:hypothetical protein
MGIDRAGPVGGFRIVTWLYFTDIFSTSSFSFFFSLVYCFMFWEGVGGLRVRVNYNQWVYITQSYFTLLRRLPIRNNNNNNKFIYLFNLVIIIKIKINKNRFCKSSILY